MITCPIFRIKILQQINETKWFETIRSLSTRSLYTGFGLQVCVESGRGVYMATYVATLRLQKEYFQFTDQGANSLIMRSVAGACAGCMGWLSIYPLDAVKSVMMSQCPQKPIYTSSWTCANALYQEGGIRRMYRGLGYTSAHI